MSRFCLAAGAAYGLLGVLLGAFGAHALRSVLSPAMLAVWETAVRYQFWHALALLAVGLLAQRGAGRWVAAAGCGFLLGVPLFSGSLYLLAWSGAGWLGAVTPVGGFTLLAGWGCLVIAAIRGPAPQ